MTFIEAAFFAASCLLTQAHAPCATLPNLPVLQPPNVEVGPERSGESVDVVLTAQAALVWDIQSGRVLYEKNASQQRPIASLTKLLSVLLIRDRLSPDIIVPIPVTVKAAQAAGAHIRLPTGEHASVKDLLAAGLIASANDALVTLAEAAAGSEEAFAQQANDYAHTHGFSQTKAANATGLSGGEQYSSAQDVREMLTAVYQDPLLQPYLAQQDGTLVTAEGTARNYTTTNKLLGTYVPIIAAKTGYTAEAGQNLAVITRGPRGQQVGAVILGSDERFQDMKVLIEWIWRNYAWPAN